MGFGVAMPWGDSERYDFMVWAKEGGRILRLQVEGTGRLHRGGYDAQPVHATRKKGKKRYTAREIDVVVAAVHAQPMDVWYLLPIRAIGRAKELAVFSASHSGGRWERCREAWEALRKR
jgi:PD-(D/E)XK endonuclease